MKVVKNLDAVEIDAADVADAIARLVFDRTGRTMDRITWINTMDQTAIGSSRPFKLAYINATLKPESE